MMRFVKAIAAIMLMMVMFFVTGCKPEDDSNNGGGNGNEIVKVMTYEPQAIMQTSAVCGGEVTKWSEGVELEELGVCWSKKSNPTVMDFHQSTLNWQEPFYYTLTDLELDTKYYVRAYAKKGEDCYYGNEVSFTTLLIQDGSTVPVVVTHSVKDVHSNYAVGKGSLISDGGTRMMECGICWSSENSIPALSDNPIFADNHVESYPFWELGDYPGVMIGLMPNTTYYVRAYATNLIGTGYGEVVSFTTSDFVAHDYVDLGLPSGTLWATCNVGATSPEEDGDYFSWGETHPKNIYSWETYKYCNGSDKLTKYCNNSDIGNNGFVDNLTVLQSEDDAARVNWGDKWRMPTQIEWEELIKNTNLFLTENAGYLFTASNGNSLVIPKAGFKEDLEGVPGSPWKVGGFYWSNSLNIDYAWEAISSCVGDSLVGTYNYYSEDYVLLGIGAGFGATHRWLGLSVRPVRSSK